MLTSWRVESQEAFSAEGAGVAIHYAADEVFGVMRPNDCSYVDIEVQQDDAPLSPENAGEDILFVDGKSMVRVDADRLYRLVKNPAYGQHFVTLFVRQGSLALHTATFRSSCE